MYAVRCTACGRPGAVALVVDGNRAPDPFQCPACGHVSALEPEIIAQLEAAATVVRTHATQARQLSTFQRRMATSNQYSFSVFLGTTALALFPFVCIFCIATGNQSANAVDFAVVLMCTTPLLIVSAVALLGYRQLRTRLSRVRELSAAIPPLAPGEPARCHVCGGVVQPLEGEAFTRCTYCHSDNLTDPRVLAGLTAVRETILENFAARATEETGQVHHALASARRSLIIGSIAALPASCLCTCPIIAVMASIETEPYPLEYTLVDAPRGRCIAEVSPDNLHPDLVRLHGDWDTTPNLDETRPRGEVPTFRYAALIGLEVIDHHDDDAEPFVIREVHGTAGTAQNLAEGHEHSHSLNHICLTDSAVAPVEPVAGPPSAEWDNGFGPIDAGP